MPDEVFINFFSNLPLHLRTGTLWSITCRLRQKARPVKQQTCFLFTRLLSYGGKSASILFT